VREDNVWLQLALDANWHYSSFGLSGALDGVLGLDFLSLGLMSFNFLATQNNTSP
jgi:hypothetical protein